MTEFIGNLKETDPREWGYRMAVAGSRSSYFADKVNAEVEDVTARELAVEGWNEHYEERDENKLAPLAMTREGKVYARGV